MGGGKGERKEEERKGGGRGRERNGEEGRVRICSRLPLAVWATMYCTYLASTNAQSIIVKLQNFEGVAGGAGQEGRDSLHSSRTKCIVAEIQLCQVGFGCDDAITKSRL